MNSKNFLLLLLIACLFVSTQCFLKPPAWKHCIKQLHALPKSWELLQSPGYPNGMSSQMQCTWVIQSNPGTRIRLAFQNFNLTGSTNNCYTQSIEIFDLVKRASMGKMCGTRRAGDFVSFGNEMRIDLLADTSNHPHQGFRLRYKQTSGKDRSGFTTKFSFPNGAEKKKKKKKPTASSSGGKKQSLPPKKKTKWDTSGGKVNFAQLFKMNRQQPRSTQQPKRVTATPELEGNSTKLGDEPIVSTTTLRTVTTTTRRKPAQRIYRPVDRWEDQAFGENDKKDEVSLYFIIGVSVGGFFSILFIIFLIKICFFSDKDKDKNEVYENYQMRQPPQQREYGSYYYGEKQTEFIDNQHHLPSTTRTTPLQLSAPEDLPPHYDVIGDRQPARETISDDEEEDRRRRRRRNRKHRRRRDNEVDDDVITKSHVIEPRQPRDQHRKPESHVTTPSDRMRAATTDPDDIPTLRRKLSPWEKHQLKIESRRMQPLGRDGSQPM